MELLIFLFFILFFLEKIILYFIIDFSKNDLNIKKIFDFFKNEGGELYFLFEKLFFDFLLLDIKFENMYSIKIELKLNINFMLLLF